MIQVIVYFDSGQTKSEIIGVPMGTFDEMTEFINEKFGYDWFNFEIL
jgi:hypothetical protein